MKTIGARIKEARLAKNMKQDDLASQLGARSAAVISSWERGTAKPDCVTLLSLCRVLEVAPNHILGFNHEATSPEEMAAIKKYRALDEHGQDLVSYVLNSEYNRVRQPTRRARILSPYNFYPLPASAGVGNFLEEIEPEKIHVRENEYGDDVDFIIPISGNSMEPTFHDGDKVFVRKQDSIEVGEIGIFIVNGDVYIKELGLNCLISHNEDYSNIPFASGDTIFCCGKVLGVAEVI